MRRNAERLEAALADACVGKISGAVGTFAHLPPAVEEAVCARLGIGYESAATQVVQRDRHAHLMSVLALIASSLDKFAVELRHLARTEVREVQEEFGKAQKGSIMGRILGEAPEFRSRAREASTIVDEVLSEVNSWTQERQRKTLEKR